MVSDGVSTIKEQLEGLSENSRVWIWQADNPIPQKQSEFVQSRLDAFMAQWTSHNQSLLAKGTFLENRFIVICLDQEISTAASGCSIDSLTHAIERIAHESNVDFFNRNICYLKIDDEIIKYQLNDLPDAMRKGTINSDTLVYDSLIDSKARLLSEWPKPLGDSWHKRFF